MVFSQIRNHKVCYFSWETYEGNEAKAKGMRTRLLILNFKSRRSSLALDLSLFPALSFLFLTFEKFPLPFLWCESSPSLSGGTYCISRRRSTETRNSGRCCKSRQGKFALWERHYKKKSMHLMSATTWISANFKGQAAADPYRVALPFLGLTFYRAYANISDPLAIHILLRYKQYYSVSGLTHSNTSRLAGLRDAFNGI